MKAPIKCPFCSKKYLDKSVLYEHLEKEHPEFIADKSIPISQFYFNIKNKKTHGSCIVCRKKTKWNNSTEKYERICCSTCKDKYVKQFKARMKSKHGKETLLNDPEHQKKMLSNRKISGKHKFQDGVQVGYVGSYELEFLKFLDYMYNIKGADVISPAPQVIKYKYNNRESFYIPDFYIPSLNLIVEVKDGGKNPNMHHKIRSVDKKKELIKDSALVNHPSYHYIKIEGKDYATFIDFIQNDNLHTKSAPQVGNQLNESFRLIESSLIGDVTLSESDEHISNEIYAIIESYMHNKDNPKVVVNKMKKLSSLYNKNKNMSIVNEVDVFLTLDSMYSSLFEHMHVDLASICNSVDIERRILDSHIII